MSVKDKYFEALRKLRPPQAAVMPAVNWLLSNSDDPSIRGSGRTLLLALGFIRQALLFPHRDIHVWDHSMLGRPANRMMQVISEVLGPNRGITVREGHFLLCKDEPSITELNSEFVSPGIPPFTSEAEGSLLEDLHATVHLLLRAGVSADSVKMAVDQAIVRITMEE